MHVLGEITGWCTAHGLGEGWVEKIKLLEDILLHSTEKVAENRARISSTHDRDKEMD